MKLYDANNEVMIVARTREGVRPGWGVVFWDDLLGKLQDNDPPSAHTILAHSIHWTDQVLDIKGKQRICRRTDGFAISRRQLLAILTERAREVEVTIQFGHAVADLTQL